MWSSLFARHLRPKKTRRGFVLVLFDQVALWPKVMALGQAFHQFLSFWKHPVQQRPAGLQPKLLNCCMLAKVMRDWRYKNPIVLAVHTKAVRQPLKTKQWAETVPTVGNVAIASKLAP